MTCTHDRAEKEAACADGMCPICAAARAELAQIEVARLTVLKTPASRQLLNITKGLLDDAEAEIERLRSQLLDPTSYATSIRERDAEIERLTVEKASALKTQDLMADEIERLNNIRAEQDLEINKLRGEIERLKKI